MASTLSKFLPLSSDPFPPTHKAGSEFEGFFIRLETHSGRTTSSLSIHHSTTKKNRTKAKDSPSRIPRLSKTSTKARNRRTRSTSSSSSSSSNSDHAQTGQESPTPSSRRTSLRVGGGTGVGTISPKTKEAMAMLTDINPVFTSPESYLPSTSTSFSGNGFKGKEKEKEGSLPTTQPGDLILVICELQSAPIDQRICIYLRWIVHGEETSLYEDLHSNERKPENASSKKRQSFEIIHYIPTWNLKLGSKRNSNSIQPFRISLPSNDSGLGFMEVDLNGNVIIDLTLPHSEKGGIRVKIRTTKQIPWHPNPSSSSLGSNGPEGYLQHLGLLLPLHWYVHSSSSPCIFSLEHTSPEGSEGENKEEIPITAGRGLFHIEKNWGQAFPSGWIWSNASSPLPLSESSFDSQNQVRLSLAGGSILNLTAFLVGINVKKQKGIWDWNFTPPFALAPPFSFNTKDGGKVSYGIGMKLYRNFKKKLVKLEVWDLTKWARIQIEGEEKSFVTKIPGPKKGGWTPGYCHHSYRCKAKVELYERGLGGLVSVPVKAAWSPIRMMKGLLRNDQEEGWVSMGWKKVVEVELPDRVALEFGGDFAQ